MSKKVLIVDDDQDLVEAMSNVLEAKGYHVVSANSGKEGFQLAKKEKPQIMLLDVMMAHKTEGFDIARNMKNDPVTKDIPVIIVTGIRKDMNVPFKFEPNNDWLPVKAVLEKPVKPNVLLKTVEENILK